jgi:hypothetical protein
LDSMLPGQSLEIGSADPKFQKLIQHVLDSPERDIGMIGLNPHTGRPLNLGVRIVYNSMLSLLGCDTGRIIQRSRLTSFVCVGHMFLDRKQGQAGFQGSLVYYSTGPTSF